jgi:putative ABC transport system substrate-binding protein
MVASLARPGGNVTGLSLQQSDTTDKRLEFLREAVPPLRRLAIMANAGADQPNRSTLPERLNSMGDGKSKLMMHRDKMEQRQVYRASAAHRFQE